jgi:hypothetical protein
MRERHHVVSQGYLRFFADGKILTLCDKVPREGAPRVRRVGTRDVFVRSHFSSYTVNGQRFDQVEDEWQRLENEALPAVRNWIAGREGPTARNEAKVLAALHFARSYGFRFFFNQVALEYRPTAMAELLEDPRLRQVWRYDRGRDPEPGEAEALIAEQFDQITGPGSPFVIERMANAYNFALEKLIPLHVQAVTPVSKGVDFITGDSPFVYYDEVGDRVGARSRLALGDAKHAYMPLGPRLGVAFTTRPEGDGVAPVSLVQEINTLVWRAAFSQVACHPATDLGRALGMNL